MNLKKFHTIIKNTPEGVKEDIRLSMDILDRINELLADKFGGKQKLLADKLGKTEAQVSRMVNGVQNFTTRTIAELSVAFGEPIIAVCTNSDQATFTQVKTPYKRECTTLKINEHGALKEETEFKAVSSVSKEVESNTNLPA